MNMPLLFPGRAIAWLVDALSFSLFDFFCLARSKLRSRFAAIRSVSLLMLVGKHLGGSPSCVGCRATQQVACCGGGVLVCQSVVSICRRDCRGGAFKFTPNRFTLNNLQFKTTVNLAALAILKPSSAQRHRHFAGMCRYQS